MFTTSTLLALASGALRLGLTYAVWKRFALLESYPLCDEFTVVVYELFVCMRKSVYSNLVCNSYWDAGLRKIICISSHYSRNTFAVRFHLRDYLKSIMLIHSFLLNLVKLTSTRRPDDTPKAVCLSRRLCFDFVPRHFL